jgi:putative glycosyltransferase (TIGR04372 family)
VRSGRLRRYDIIVVPSQSINFGNTVYVPDIMRRTHRGKAILFIIPWDKGSGPNPATGSIFPDVSIWFFKLFMLRFTLLGKKIAFPHPNAADRVFHRIFGLLAPILAPRAEFLDWKQAKLMPIPDELRPLMKDGPEFPFWNLGIHSWLQRKISVPRLSLPEEKRRRIHDRLAEARKGEGGDGETKLCIFYSCWRDHQEFHFRTSAHPDSYVPAFRFLVSRGYQVMMTGDMEMSPGCRREFGGMVVDAESLGVDRKTFLVFAGTEADLFIGDEGGGNVMPSINGAPILILNACPLGGNVNEACVFPKKCTDEDGHVLSLDEIVETKDLGSLTPELKFYPNTEDEILEAVEFFLAEIEGSSPVCESLCLGEIFPDHLYFVLSRIRLSKAYVRRFCPELLPAHDDPGENVAV